MTPSEWTLFLNGAAMVCAFMVVLNLAMFKKRGTSSLILGTAFLAAGVSIMSVARSGITTAAYAGGAVVFCLLVGDFVYRSAKLKQR